MSYQVPRHRQPEATHAGMVPVPVDRLPELIGSPIHLRGQKAGCVWILRRIEGDLMHLETPKTHRTMTSHVKNALYVRGIGPENAADWLAERAAIRDARRRGIKRLGAGPRLLR